MKIAFNCVLWTCVRSLIINQNAIMLLVLSPPPLPQLTTGVSSRTTIIADNVFITDVCVDFVSSLRLHVKGKVKVGKIVPSGKIMTVKCFHDNS